MTNMQDRAQLFWIDGKNLKLVAKLLHTKIGVIKKISIHEFSDSEGKLFYTLAHPLMEKKTHVQDLRKAVRDRLVKKHPSMSYQFLDEQISAILKKKHGVYSVYDYGYSYVTWSNAMEDDVLTIFAQLISGNDNASRYVSDATADVLPISNNIVEIGKPVFEFEIIDRNYVYETKTKYSDVRYPDLVFDAKYRIMYDAFVDESPAFKFAEERNVRFIIEIDLPLVDVGETLRQIKRYRRYMKGMAENRIQLFVVIISNKKSDFAPIFENEGFPVLLAESIGMI